MSRNLNAAGAAPAGRTRHGLAFTKVGDGPPLVLLHGIGGSRWAWAPVLERLAGSHTVYAVDLPGFAESGPLDDGVAPTPRRIAEAVGAALDEWGVDRPHLAGNSLGAWIALELAALRPVASLTLLSPAGLWKRRQPVYDAVSFALIWFGCRYGTRLLTALSRRAWGRRLVFWQIYARPEVRSPEDAIRDITDLVRGPGFWPAMRASRRIRYQATKEVAAPVTLAFGDSDRVLLARQARFTDQLPPHTRHLVLPGAGHVPMSDAPELVSRVILTTTGAASR
jgi:pimeloyl-ACP methyl ester carboxylesterase